MLDISTKYPWNIIGWTGPLSGDNFKENTEYSCKMLAIDVFVAIDAVALIANHKYESVFVSDNYINGMNLCWFWQGLTSGGLTEVDKVFSSLCDLC